MAKNTKYLFLFLLLLSILLPKWIVSEFYLDNSIFISTIFNVKDIQYFPIVISFSDFTFNPSYLDHIRDVKLISFPVYGVIFHSIFYKIIGVYSFIILEFIIQFFFLVIFLKVISKIFNNLDYSIYFCILLFLFIALVELILIYENSKYLKFLFNTLDESLGTRLPRPLFTGIIYFYFFYTLFAFREKLKKNDFKYFLLILFLLSIFLNSFFYYFYNFSLLTFFLLIKYLDKDIIKLLINNKIKLIFIISGFLIFSLPFLIQLFYGESDYSERIGVIQLNFDQKIYLLKYYFINLLRLESILLLIPVFFLNFYLNKNFTKFKDEISRINIFFNFVIISIISPPIFFILSPKVISIYHFLGILIFALTFYLIIAICFIILQKFKAHIKSVNFLRFGLIFLILISNIFINKNNINRNKEVINEIGIIQIFLENNNLVNTDKKLFTNDLRIMNLWLLNKNSQLLISDGFTNSLKNIQIEEILLTNLKNFGLTSDEVENFFSVGKSSYRDDFLMRIFNYRYQANSLYTFSSKKNYNKSQKLTIEKTSPFRVQSQITPEDEKLRIIDLFSKINLDEKLLSDVVIINKLNSFKNFKIRNKKYKQIYSSNFYEIYLIS